MCRLSNCVILSFQSPEICYGFTDLYNNLQFPMHRNTPPCLVVPLQRISAHCTAVIECTSEKLPKYLLGRHDEVHSSNITGSKQLPVCSVCLRRIKTSTSKIVGSNDIPVFTYLYGNEERCQYIFLIIKILHYFCCVLSGATYVQSSALIW